MGDGAMPSPFFKKKRAPLAAGRERTQRGPFAIILLLSQRIVRKRNLATHDPAEVQRFMLRAR